MKRLYPPLRYHGGKYELASKLIALMPPHLHYVEPYFGGGHVLLAKDPEGVSEVANDINGELMAFWQVLRNGHLLDELTLRLFMTPVSEQMFEWANCPAGPEDPKVIVAAKLFVRFRLSRQGLGKDFATLSRTRTRRGMNEQVSQYLGAIEGLPEVHERLQRVVILNRDALDVIYQQDGPNTFYFLDPPYMTETRTAGGYDYDVNREHHEDLLESIQRVKGKVMLSGYMNPLYRYELNDWRLVTFDRAKNSSSSATKPRAVECVWMNY